MIKQEVLPYAYTEVIEILKYISEEYVRNIPKEIIEYFQEKSKKDYEYTVTEFDTFENQEMLYETRVILSILYRDYFVSEEVKTKIIQKEYIEMQSTLQIKFNQLWKHRQTIRTRAAQSASLLCNAMRCP